MISCVVLLASGCGSQSIVVARSTKLPEEVDGFMRVLQEEPVTVGVIGKDIIVERTVAGYVLLHEQDAAQLVRNTAELQALKAAKVP